MSVRSAGSGSDRSGDGMLDDFMEDPEQELEQHGNNAGSSASAASSDVGVAGINTQAFEELRLPGAVVEAVQASWQFFVSAAGGRGSAGEAIYGAVFDAAPSLQSLFKTPRAVQSMRFATQIHILVDKLHDPVAFKIHVETLSFQHLSIEVTPARIVVFRDALLELVAAELGDRLTEQAVQGWTAFFNYIGGAYIYVRTEFGSRLKLLSQNWAVVNSGVRQNLDEEDEAQAAVDAGNASAVVVRTTSVHGKPQEGAGQAGRSLNPAAKRQNWWGNLRGSGERAAKSDQASGSFEQERRKGGGDGGFQQMHVPTTFAEMFQFNAAVMGFAGNAWMREVLDSFDAIVNHVADNQRLQEECDVLSLRIARCRGQPNLKEFKAVMLASLRSLLPKDWNSECEIAWSWLWANVEKILQTNLGRPAAYEKALRTFYRSLDAQQLDLFRNGVYSNFFAKCSSGQHYFKQSTTRLHFIADKIVSLTADIFSDPRSVVDDISALGLRHVGYGIPTDLFGPFVSSAVEVVDELTRGLSPPGMANCEDDACHIVLEAFRWSLGLVSRILVRTVNEGSTLVMKAINANSARQLRQAVSLAPRGERAQCMLKVQVGSQAISPLFCALESGSQEAANAILIDLLTIRADRDHYYYAVDELFTRHPDIVRRLCLDAPPLLTTLLNGLVWRSRLTDGGLRRVNYYIKHLIVDVEGGLSRSLRQIIQYGDPRVVCHPVVALSLDLVWSKLASHMFLWNKLWFIFSLVVFVVCQSILERLDTGEDTSAIDVVILICRIFIYTLCLGQLLFRHGRETLRALSSRDLRRDFGVPVPSYLFRWTEVVTLLLALAILLMLVQDPLLYCHHQGQLYKRDCPRAAPLQLSFSIFSTLAVFLYFVLAIDLSVFSTRVSAFVLVCQSMFGELALFLAALACLLLTFSCSVTALDQEHPGFGNVGQSALSLLRMFLGMSSDQTMMDLEETPALFVGCVVFVIGSWVFLLNVLVAQLCCAYRSTFEDMLGMAQLNRGRILLETLPSVSLRRWDHFVQQLRLDRRLEFNEGDIGLAGGVQLLEPASLNPVTAEQIRRFGGSTAPELPWPEVSNGSGDGEGDKFERMERMLGKALKRITASAKGGASGSRVGSAFTSSVLSGSSNAPSSGSFSSQDGGRL